MLKEQNRPTDLDLPRRDDANGGDAVMRAFSSLHYRRRPRLPEISMLEAMLDDALRCMQGSHRGLSRRDFLEAYQWFASERRDWPFSFLSVCDFLGVDPSALRDLLGVRDEHAGDAFEGPQMWLKRASTLSAARRPEARAS